MTDNGLIRVPVCQCEVTSTQNLKVLLHKLHIETRCKARCDAGESLAIDMRYVWHTRYLWRGSMACSERDLTLLCVAFYPHEMSKDSAKLIREEMEISGF